MGRSLLLAAALAGLASGAAAARPTPRPAPRTEARPVAPQADPAIALRRQLADALAAGTSAALILFLARYPDEPESGTARAALAARRAPDPVPDPGPDGAIAAAFDRARLAGPAALDAFAARTDNHPLGSEARRWSRRLGAGKDAGPESREIP